jgi:hypothetical protein
MVATSLFSKRLAVTVVNQTSIYRGITYACRELAYPINPAQQITVGVGVNFLASPCTVYSLTLSGWWCGHLLAWSFRWQVMSEAS